MRPIKEMKLRCLVTSNKIPKFVIKLFFMDVISDFKNGETVCLKHDKTKRFIVKNNLIINDMIQVVCFSELTCTMVTTLIDPEYLMIAPKQE